MDVETIDEDVGRSNLDASPVGPTTHGTMWASTRSNSIEGHQLPTKNGVVHEEELTDDVLFGGDTCRYQNGRLKKFRPTIFLFEFVTQSLWPLSIPTVLLVQGTTAAKNKHMLPKASKQGMVNFMWQTINCVMSWLPLIVVLAAGLDELITLTALLGSAAAMRFLVIAGKYSSFTEEYYDALMTSPELDCSQSLLATVWYERVAEEQQHHLLNSAFRYCGVDPDTIGHLVFHNEKHSTMSAKVYMQRAIGVTYGQSANKALLVGNSVVGHTIMFIWPILFYVKHFGVTSSPDLDLEHEKWVLATLCLLALQALMYPPTVYRYWLAGALHYHRKFKLMSLLHEMVLQLQTHQRPDEYMIRLDEAKNLHVWSQMRCVAREFGRVYEHRVAFNAVASVVGLVSLFLLMLVMTFSDWPFDYVLAGCVVFSFVSVAAFAMATLVIGVSINSLDIQSGALLAKDEEYLMNQDHSGGKDTLKVLDKIQQYRTTRFKIENKFVSDPVTFAYAPATSAMISAFGAAITGVISFQVSVFTVASSTAKF